MNAKRASSQPEEFEPVLEELLVLRASKTDERKRRSFVTLTYAQALDGSIATGKGGAPLQLSNAKTMRMTHRLRAVHDGILVGINTVVSDDPSLTTRLCAGTSPRPIVMDSDLRCPPQAKLIQLRKQIGAPGPIIVAQDKRVNCAAPENDLERDRRRSALEAEGAIVVCAPRDWETLFVLFRDEFGLESVMIEGGARIIRSALTEGAAIIDAVIVTIAPLYVGGLVPTQPWDGTRQHTRLEVHRSILVDSDIVFCATLDTHNT